MTSRNERLQEIWHRYENEPGHKPSSTRDAVERAVQEGLLEPPSIDPIDILAEQMAAALRAEYARDAKGRRYRVNHAVRITKNSVQYCFWASMDFASRAHMEKSFAQRRELIINDCTQLKVDVDAYNELSNTPEPVQLVLDFTEDVEERLVAIDDAKEHASQNVGAEAELEPV
jgi:hypothetical protein